MGPLRTSLAGLLALAIVPAVGLADQSDQRLDAMFAELLATQDDAAARQLQGQIWQIWYEHDDTAIVLLMRQGRGAMNRQDFRAAERSFDQVVTIAPDYAEGWNARATLYYLMGRYDDSLGDIDKTLALEPRHFGALSGLAMIRMAQDRPHDAREALRRMLEVHPHADSARRRLERIERRLGVET